MAHRPRTSRISAAGFTLVELLTAVLVLAILATIAVPGFNSILRNNRLYQQSNDFYLALMRARSEAMSRVQRVTICKSNIGNGTIDPTSVACTTSGSWDQGWVVFVEDVTQNAAIDSGEEVLEIQRPLQGGNTLRGSTNVANSITYQGTGSSVQTGDLALCDTRGASLGREISIKATGRPRVTTGPASCSP